jgi:hypothetical protein
MIELSNDGSLESESYITTDGQSASLSWNKVPTWDLRPDFYYCQIVAGLLMWAALSDERADLTFTTAAGSHQRSHFRVRVPWDSRPYFNVSDLRLPFCRLVRLAGLRWRYSTPPPRLSLILRPTVSRPVSLGMKHPSGAYDRIFIIVKALLRMNSPFVTSRRTK